MQLKHLFCGFVISGALAVGAGCGSNADPPAEPEGEKTGQVDQASRKDGLCCTVRCRNGCVIVNEWLTHGCDAWAVGACRNCSSSVNDAWWGSC